MADRLKKLERELGLPAAPSPFAMDPKIICRRVEKVLSAEERERKCYMKHKLRLAAVFTAAALALTGTALAAGPTLLQAALGAFAPYARTMEGTAVDQDIQVKLVSALADSTHVKVYFELTDLAGQDRLALMGPDIMYSHLDLDIPEDQIREGVGYSWGLRRLGYDPDTQTLLMVLERSNGVLLSNGPTGKLRIGRLTSRRLDTGETVPVPGQSDIEGNWTIPLTLKQVEEHSSPLSGTLGPVELKELRLSTLGITIVTEALNDRINGYPMWAFFSDGTKVPLDRGQTGSGGYGGLDLNRWDFQNPIEDLSSITGVSIGYWMIPVENGVAGEGYWLAALPE